MNSKLKAVLESLTSEEKDELTTILLKRLARRVTLKEQEPLPPGMTTEECIELANLIAALQAVHTENCPIL